MDKIVKMGKTLDKTYYKMCKIYLKFCDSSFTLGGDHQTKRKISYMYNVINYVCWNKVAY